MIEEGKKAPAFKLESSDGGQVSSSDFEGKWLVLYFYPKDDTSGCTLEAKDFRDRMADFKRKKAVVLGVSKDSIASHCKFRDKHDLTFPLLSDPTGAVVEKFGAWGEKNMYGRKSMGILRTTVIVAPDGKVARVFRKVRVAGHVDAVLDALGELAKK